MPCCGGQRTQAIGSTVQNRPPVERGRSPRRYSVAYFQYVGPTGLTVHGPASGKNYRFEAPGATLAVDLADRASLAAVPHLRQVLGP